MRLLLVATLARGTTGLPVPPLNRCPSRIRRGTAAAIRRAPACTCVYQFRANKDQGTTDDGTTPLFMAAHQAHLEVVRVLVESGANKDRSKTDDGATTVFIAAQRGHLEVVRFLVESGANKDQSKTDDGATPLFIAAAKGHLEVVRVLPTKTRVRQITE